MGPIQLGEKVRDKVTGFVGIATARIKYLNGCIQFCVKPEVTEPGKMPDGIYIDDIQLEVIGEGLTVIQEPDGGPQQDVPSATYCG